MSEKEKTEKLVPAEKLPSEILELEIHNLADRLGKLEVTFSELTDALIQAGILKRVKE